MEVKLNSNVGFCAKKSAYAQTVVSAEQRLMVRDPFSHRVSTIKGFDKNISIVGQLPKDVLESATKQVFDAKLKKKPHGFKFNSSPMREIWANLVCDTTLVGEKARNILNNSISSGLGKKLVATAKSCK